MKPILACLLAVGALAACGTSKPAAAPSPTPSSTPRPTPTASPTPTIHAFTISAKGPLRVGGGMTKPKRTLRFGQAAIVPVEFYDQNGNGLGKRGVVSIVVQPPRKASAKLAAQLGADVRPAKGEAVYYLPVVITNVSNVDLTGYGGPRLTAALRSGGGAGYQIGLGGVAGCDPHGQALELSTLGSSDTTCVIGPAPQKDPLGQVTYRDAPYGTQDMFNGPDYNKYYDLGLLTWR